jgi:hypothetical protein
MVTPPQEVPVEGRAAVNPAVRLIRAQPHLYSVICKARLFHSRYIAARHERGLYRRDSGIFAMSELERRHCEADEPEGEGLMSSSVPT